MLFKSWTKKGQLNYKKKNNFEIYKIIFIVFVQ